MGRLISRRNNLNFFDSVDVRELGLSDILEIHDIRRTKNQ